MQEPDKQDLQCGWYISCVNEERDAEMEMEGGCGRGFLEAEEMRFWFGSLVLQSLVGAGVGLLFVFFVFVNVFGRLYKLLSVSSSGGTQTEH